MRVTTVMWVCEYFVTLCTVQRHLYSYYNKMRLLWHVYGSLNAIFLFDLGVNRPIEWMEDVLKPRLHQRNMLRATCCFA